MTFQVFDLIVAKLRSHTRLVVFMERTSDTFAAFRLTWIVAFYTICRVIDFGEHGFMLDDHALSY